MEAKKISELDEASNVTDIDVMLIVSGGKTKKIKFSRIKNSIPGGGSKGVPLGAWMAFENDRAPNDEWLQAGTTFDESVYPELYEYLEGNTIPERYDHNRISDYSQITLPYGAENAITMPYDGFLFYTFFGGSTSGASNIYVNNDLAGALRYNYSIPSFSFNKGDQIYVSNNLGALKVAYHNHPMFIKATE